MARQGRECEKPQYEKGRTVRGALRRYEWVCRWMGRPRTVMPGERTSHAEGVAYRPLERDVAFAVDMERFLGALDGFDRAVLVLVGLRGLSEVIAAKRLHSGQARVSRRYWQAVEEMFRLLVWAKYVRPLENNNAEEQTEKAGAKSSVAQVASRVAGARREAAGARGV